MDIALKTRITKIFAMLGSEHAGERDNASILLNKIAAEHKLTLTELLAQANTATASPSSYRSPFGSRATNSGPTQAERDRQRANDEARAREKYRQQEQVRREREELLRKQQETLRKAAEEAGKRMRAEPRATNPFTGGSRELLDTLAKVEDKPELASRILTSWELDFAQDVAARYSSDDDLSEKQLVYVNRIVTKMKRHFP